MTKNQNTNNFRDFSDFSDTEKKLAEIWKDVLSLSTQEYEGLNKESDFLDLTPSWCKTIEINLLSGQISRIFEISVDSIAVDDCSTLKDQAAEIDRAIKVAHFNRLIEPD